MEVTTSDNTCYVLFEAELAKNHPSQLFLEIMITFQIFLLIFSVALLGYLLATIVWPEKL